MRAPAGAPVALTVLGAVPVTALGVVSAHEALLSVVPGAQYAYDITLDRAEIFAVLAAKLAAFKRAGGGTVVDSTGMFHGRDVRLLEALARATGVHIIASTGLGPEEMLGGYFRTPQANPPTPWPAERFADLFAQEVTAGMVVPRVERRGRAGIIAVAATRAGLTATDESLVRGAARAARATGVPASIRFGADAVHDLQVALDEGLPADRIVVGGLDRKDALATHAALAVARRGAYAAIDHIGSGDDVHTDDDTRAALVAELVRAGHADRIVLSSDAIGYAVAQPARELCLGHVLADFVPRLRAQGLAADELHQIVDDNPRRLLAVRPAGPHGGAGPGE